MFRQSEKKIALRDPEMGYDDLAPGVYPGEALLDVDGVGLVAVSCKSSWLENGAGVAFQSWARAVEDDGQTLTGPEGQHVETTAIFTAQLGFVEAIGIDAVTREILLAVLGEPLTHRATGNGDETAPIIPWHDDWLLSASIRHAVRTVQRTLPEASVDPADLLAILATTEGAK